jgi:hypothetical protein
VASPGTISSIKKSEAPALEFEKVGAYIKLNPIGQSG